MSVDSSEASPLTRLSFFHVLKTAVTYLKTFNPGAVTLQRPCLPVGFSSARVAASLMPFKEALTRKAEHRPRGGSARVQTRSHESRSASASSFWGGPVVWLAAGEARRQSSTARPIRRKTLVVRGCRMTPSLVGARWGGRLLHYHLVCCLKQSHLITRPSESSARCPLSNSIVGLTSVQHFLLNSTRIGVNGPLACPARLHPDLRTR